MLLYRAQYVNGNYRLLLEWAYSVGNAQIAAYTAALLLFLGGDGGADGA